MLRNILVILLICSLKQNNAFVIPLNAGNAGFEAESLVSDHQLEKKTPQSLFPDFPFEPTSNSDIENAQLPFPIDLPQFGMQFATNGLQTGLSSGFGMPFQSGNLIDPGGKAFRDLGQDILNQPLPQNGVVTGSMSSMNQNGNQPPVFRTESFNMTPEGQQLYENGKLVENIPNQGPISTTQGATQTVTVPKGSVPQVQSGVVPQPNLSNVQQSINPSTPLNQIPSNPNFSTQVQQPGNPNQHNNPAVKVSSVGASSSTFMSSTNNQPPEMSQSAGAYDYHYDSTKPDPVNGGFMTVNGYTPNIYDPNQGNYQYAHGSFPSQQNTGGHVPNPFNPNPTGYPNPQQAINQLPNQHGYPNPQHVVNQLIPNQPGYPNPQQVVNQLIPNQTGYPNPQPVLNQLPNQSGYQNFPQGITQQPILSPGNTNYKQGTPQISTPGRQNNQPISYQPPQSGYQNYWPQGYPTQQGVQYNNGQHMSMIPQQIGQHIGRLNDHLSSIGMPRVDPSAVMAPLTQLMQTMPNMMRSAASQGLQISKIPLDMSNAALNALSHDLGNVNVKEIAQIPTEFGRAIVSSIEEMINQFQRNLISIQPNQQPTLGRRSPEPWQLPNFDISQYYNSIPFSTAQEKINNMKEDIYNKMQAPTIPSFNQMNQPFNYFSKPQMPQMPQMQMPQMPQLPKPSANGEPVVKVYSSSVSESTQSSSKNGGPPEVSHQAAGYKYDYDSTNKNNPVQSDLVAMKGYTPDASDPDQGSFVAYENSYP